MKTCIVCKKSKTLEEFYKFKTSKDGYVNSCKECNKEYRKNHGHAYYMANRQDQAKRQKTLERYKSKLYSAMKGRIKWVKAYKGIKLLITRKEFLNWINSQENYPQLHKNWVSHNYDRKYAPSIDRINSNGNYEFSNIQLLTMSENMIRAWSIPEEVSNEKL